MIEYLPSFISWIFVTTTLTTLFLFYRAAGSRTLLLGLAGWLVLQGALTYHKLYLSELEEFPPAIVLYGLLPPFLSIIITFLTPRGKTFIDKLSPSRLTYLHVIRIPVEFVIWWLFLQGTVPELMTFQGRNFDILVGLTAAVIAYFGYVRRTIRKSLIVAWNFLSLALVLHVFVIAILSTPSPIQQLAFKQPNIAVLYFPFSWLPTFVVPIVVFAHLASIKQLLDPKTNRDVNSF